MNTRGVRLTSPSKTSQRGAAIITAVLIVMLAATVASLLLAQQAEALTRVQRATERAQLNLFANTTLEWARSALLMQQKNSTYIALMQPWAEGLIARPIESATASGLMRDEQAKFNVNNLIDANGKRRDTDVDVFARLLDILKLDAGIANAVVDWLDADDDVSSPGGAENGYYWSQRPAYRSPNRAILTIDELRRVKGVDEKVFAALSPFITALPRPLPSTGERTKININTTSAEVLQAALNNITPAEVAEIIRLRELPFKDAPDIKTRHPKLSPVVVDGFLDAKSRYFEAALSITGESTQVRQSALLQLQNPPQGAVASIWPAIIWVKEQ